MFGREIGGTLAQAVALSGKKNRAGVSTALASSPGPSKNLQLRPEEPAAGQPPGRTDASGKIKRAFRPFQASARRGSQEQEGLPRDLGWDI